MRTQATAIAFLALVATSGAVRCSADDRGLAQALADGIRAREAYEPYLQGCLLALRLVASDGRLTAPPPAHLTPGGPEEPLTIDGYEVGLDFMSFVTAPGTYAADSRHKNLLPNGEQSFGARTRHWYQSGGRAYTCLEQGDDHYASDGVRAVLRITEGPDLRITSELAQSLQIRTGTGGGGSLAYIAELPEARLDAGAPCGGVDCVRMSLRQEGRSFDYWYAVDRSCVRMRAVTGRLAQREGEHDTLTIEQVGALTRTDDGTWFPTRTETHYYRRESGQTEWSLDWYLLWVVDELRTSEPGASMFAPLLPNPTRIFMPDGAVEVYGSETALMEEAILKGDLPLVEQMLPSDEELFGEGAA